MKDQLKQAYKQKPWRIQIRWVLRILVVLIISVVSLILHLDLTTQAAQAGVEIRVLESERELLIREISNKRTQLAILTSSTIMHKRAEELGFRPATAEDIEYLYMDEYLTKDANITFQQTTLNLSDSDSIEPRYLQSIWDRVFSGTIFYLERGGR
jgi:hypothetical protein